MKNIIKHVICLALVFCFLACGTGAGLLAFTDENDLISGEGAQIGGAPGNGSYMNVYCMWKITVYVGKSDKLAISSGTAGFDQALGSQSLTDDYYKFGNTFYLYRDQTRGAGLAAANYSPDKIFLTVRDKEWYRRNLDDFISGGINASDYFKQGTLRELSGIVFDGSQKGLTGSLSVPDIPLFGGSNDAAVSFFSSGSVSDVLIGLAAESAGATVNELLASKRFTVNGRSAAGSQWGTNMLTAVRGTDGIHTSCVPWVIEYEPVVTVQLKNSGHAMAFTATEIGVAMICGRYNFTSNPANVDAVFRPSEAALKARVSGTYLTMGLAALFQNLPASAYVSKGWFGYPNLDSMPKIESHGATAARYVTDQIKAGGVGLRYQVSEAELVRISKTVTSEGPGSGACGPGGFEFTITAASGSGNIPGEVYRVVTDADGNAEIRLRKGTYRIAEESPGTGFEAGPVTSPRGRVTKNAAGEYVLTVGDSQNIVNVENFYRTGVLRIRKQSETDDFSDLYFTVSGLDGSNRKINITVDSSGGPITGKVVTSYGESGTEIRILGTVSQHPPGLDITAAESRENGRYVREIVLSGIPLGRYAVKEVVGGDRDRFIATYADGNCQETSLEASASLTSAGEEKTVTFYNMSLIDTTVEIIKNAYDGDFSETYFGLSGDVNGEAVRLYVDSSGNICPGLFYVDGPDGTRPLRSANEDLLNGRILVSAEDTDADGHTLRKITVKGLPEGTWTVTEEVGGNNERYSSVSTEYRGASSEGNSRGITAARGRVETLTFYNVRKIKLTVNFLDKYDYAKGVRTKIRDSFVFEIVCGENYDKRDLLSEYGHIAGSRDYYFAFQGLAIGSASGDPLYGAAGEEDLEADVTYGYFHTITVRYRDKYTNEILYAEEVLKEPEVRGGS